MYVHYNDIGNPARLGHYLRRRFTRVMPTYWVALALTVAMGIGGSGGFPSFADLAWSASLVPSNHELLLGIAWTLRYEITFYAVFCALILHRGAGIAVLTLWLAGILLAATGAVDVGWLRLAAWFPVRRIQPPVLLRHGGCVRNEKCGHTSATFHPGHGDCPVRGCRIGREHQVDRWLCRSSPHCLWLACRRDRTRCRSLRPPVRNQKRPIVADARSCFLLNLSVPVHLHRPNLACLAGCGPGSGDASYCQLSIACGGWCGRRNSGFAMDRTSPDPAGPLGKAQAAPHNWRMMAASECVVSRSYGGNDRLMVAANTLLPSSDRCHPSLS